MFLVVCEFLLLKPSLDVSNVPEFYKLFYSARLEVTSCKHWANRSYHWAKFSYILLLLCRPYAMKFILLSHLICFTANKIQNTLNIC